MAETDDARAASNPETKLSEKIAGEVVLSDDPGSTLRKWRENFGVSQSELSERLDVSVSVVSDYESGRRQSPGANVVRRTVDALIEIDRERGGETLRRYRRILGAGFEGDAIKDLRDYETPVDADDFYDAIDADVVHRASEDSDDDTTLAGHTVIDSVKAITSLSNAEFTRLYGWTTQRALVFTRVSRGESPLVAIRVTSLKPRAVVLHGIDEDEMSDLAPRLARIEGIDLSVTQMDLSKMISRINRYEEE
ncbi:MAG: helix-turn-helix domain-containing protein [Halobacteria archaeon]|nr:helix-turn-helix domain-containing protein [Halobacteria archaeon]